MKNISSPLITAEFVDMTPALAKQMLESNTGNRRMRGWWVEALKNAIKRGEWITTHQGVAITANGRLVDGQHRLEAVAQSNITVKMLVVRGISEEAFTVIDAGIKRSVSDLTGLDKNCASVSRLATSIAFPGTDCMSAQKVLTVANCGIIELHHDLMTACPSTLAYFSSAPMRLAAIILVMNGHPKSHVFKVYADLIRQNYDTLPMIAKSLNRQVVSKNINAAKSLDTLARGLKALSPEYASFSLLKVSDNEVKASTELARETIKNAIIASETVSLKQAA